MGKNRGQFQAIPELDNVPKPFLRWAGGKRKLTDLLTDSIPRNFDFQKGRYFEPFVGGGAFMFALGNKDSETYIPGKNIFINDTNPDLIASYRVIKTDIYKLIERLKRYSKDVSKSAFERMRNLEPRDDISRAARFIYLNKTCFNGLWRVNSKGDFNVPWGKLKSPAIFNEENLLACSIRLKGSHISGKDFARAVEKCRSGDLVYFDPPYLPISASSSFSKYAKDDFAYHDHEKLADTIRELTTKGVYVILSNSDTELGRELFGRVLTLHQVPMSRSISASGSSRKPVMEILGTNFVMYPGARLSTFKELNRFKGTLP